MQKNYIPLRVNRDFGDIITTYFDFFKQNIKKFTNVFLSYNGIFLVALLIVSYLLVSGFMGMIAAERSTFGLNRPDSSEQDYLILIGAGGILFFFVFIAVAILNYSLSTSYMVKYDEKEGNQFDKKEVWGYARNQLGNIVLFVLLLIPIYIIFMIIAIICAIIPILGIFAQYIIQYFLIAWVGVSFFDMLQNNKGVTAALGEGWNLVTKNFWRSVGVNFVLGLLLGILILVALIVPGVIIGFYTFHVVQNDVDFVNSVVATIVYTLGTCVVLIVAVYGQCLTQFGNGLLYYTLHEKTYNIHTRKKIEQIGESL
ncbi:hypothetical protein [Croceivirga thetidis]|uniref:Glycerophosphoryl diester phosphodiesterase membrane domain-containing protein n=1 Tax=Croceivirga thetidis TaxID=2721623 RepID=A0ABX1GS78_9FLAO|nr:hypothetical protein [Croceivirga thetidis]NKI31881.1 hypothetical protein [Croceivirga thetidis]